MTNQDHNAIAYHQDLATDWDQRYQKPAFRARLQAFADCLVGRELMGQQWLDAGCGSGALARFLAEKGAEVLGVDAAQDMVAAARRLGEQSGEVSRLRFELVETIARLPVGDQSMDGILCSSVLEYVPDLPGCLTEFARVLRSGGRVAPCFGPKPSLAGASGPGAHA